MSDRDQKTPPPGIEYWDRHDYQGKVLAVVRLPDQGVVWVLFLIKSRDRSEQIHRWVSVELLRDDRDLPPEDRTSDDGYAWFASCDLRNEYEQKAAAVRRTCSDSNPKLPRE